MSKIDTSKEKIRQFLQLFFDNLNCIYSPDTVAVKDLVLVIVISKTRHGVAGQLSKISTAQDLKLIEKKTI